MDSEKFFGKRLKEIRKNNNLSQSELAERLGVDEKYISRLETGNSTPSFSMLIKISKVLNIELETLFKFKHFKSEEELKENINKIIENIPEEKLRIIYRIIEDFV